MYYYVYSNILYLCFIIRNFFKKIFLLCDIKYVDNDKHVKWNPHLCDIDYTYSKDEYDRTYIRSPQYDSFSFL